MYSEASRKIKGIKRKRKKKREKESKQEKNKTAKEASRKIDIVSHICYNLTW